MLNHQEGREEISSGKEFSLGFEGRVGERTEKSCVDLFCIFFLPFWICILDICMARPNSSFVCKWDGRREPTVDCKKILDFVMNKQIILC